MVQGVYHASQQIERGNSMSIQRFMSFAALVLTVSPTFADGPAMVEPSAALAKARSESKPILLYVYDSG